MREVPAPVLPIATWEVLGGSGFVGSAICKAAVSKGIEVISLSRSENFVSTFYYYYFLFAFLHYIYAPPPFHVAGQGVLLTQIRGWIR